MSREYMEMWIEMKLSMEMGMWMGMWMGEQIRGTSGVVGPAALRSAEFRWPHDSAAWAM